MDLFSEIKPLGVWLLSTGMVFGQTTIIRIYEGGYHRPGNDLTLRHLHR